MTSSADGDGAELARARTEALNLVQWLSRIANSYVTGDRPEQRTELEFRVKDPAFVTRDFEAGLALEIRLPALHMQFLEHGKPAPHVFDPEEHSPAAVEAWLLVELLHRGIDRDKFSKALPYEMSGLMTGDAEDHSPQSCARGLERLTILFRDAADLLTVAARAGGAKRVRILCDPRTLTLRCAGEPAGPQDSLRFSPGDTQHPEPHFYADRAPNGNVRTLTRPMLKAAAVLGGAKQAESADRLLALVSG